MTQEARSTQTATIVVDGDPSDWFSLEPAYLDPKGDCECSQDYDIKAIFTAIDSNYAYIMVETYGIPINKSAILEINFDYKPGQHFGHGPLDDLGTNFRGSDIYAWVDIDLDGKSEDYPIAGYSVVRGDVLEARIPLSEIGNPSYFNVTFLNIWNGSSSCDVSKNIPSPSPLKIDYVLTISNPTTGKATVTMNVSELSNTTFEIEEHGYHGFVR